MSWLDLPEAQALLGDAEVSASQVAGCRRHLQIFLQRYLPCFYRVEQHELARVVLQGKLSGLQRKTSEPIAYQAGRQRIYHWYAEAQTFPPRRTPPSGCKRVTVQPIVPCGIFVKEWCRPGVKRQNGFAGRRLLPFPLAGAVFGFTSAG